MKEVIALKNFNWAIEGNGAEVLIEGDQYGLDITDEQLEYLITYGFVKNAEPSKEESK